MKKHIFLQIILSLLCLLTTCTIPFPETEIDDHFLWYAQPAEEWVEALPLGNGRLGAMVFGRPTNERIQLNHDSMWPAEMGWDEPEGNKEDLERIRQLLMDGENAEADRLFVEKFSRKGISRSHQTLGDLFIDLRHDNITDYRRELNLSTAISRVSYRTNGYLFTQETFVSSLHRAIVVVLETEAPNGLNGRLRLNRPEDKGFPTATTTVDENNLLVMKGEVTQRGGMFDSKATPILEGVKFEARLKVDNEGGIVAGRNGYLQLSGVKKAILYVVAHSSFNYGEDHYPDQNTEALKTIDEDNIGIIKRMHIEDHQRFYARTQFQLEGPSLDSLPTDERLARIKSGTPDPGLESLLFHYGRYLLISSSRQGTNPANLQGLWNEHIEAPWNADYHMNINLQMNYWLANVTNLSELNRPLFGFADKLIENGKVTASKNFGCRGSFIPHATDIWTPTFLRASTAYWGCSVGAAGWMAQHYWDHYEFTKDQIFLGTRAYPAIRKVAQFYSDWIIEDPRDGTLVSAPSTSPENRYIHPNGDTVATCLGSAMDQQIIAEVFDHYVKACEILQVDNELLQTIKEQRRQLRPGFVLASDGRILEWDREYKEFEPGHRHMSHLYGFHPGNEVTKSGKPELFEAVRKTLDYRLENGGAGTGWSRAWLINCSARLMDGEMAHEHIQQLFKRSMYDNLFDSHPPFQIDGNFGYTAGVAEMLLQSHEENIIRLLPALPSAWASGHIKGLKARGDMVLDIYWKNGELEKTIIYAGKDNEFDLVFNEEVTPVTLKKGESYIYQTQLQ